MSTEDSERNNVLYKWIKPNLTTNTYYFENKAIDKALKKNFFQKIYQWLIMDL